MAAPDDTADRDAADHDAADRDPYLWLEEVTGEEALTWVRARNAAATAELAGGERFAALNAEIREVLDADDRIPYVRWRGPWLYNFWQDADHVRGLWRRTSLESYRDTRPDWQVLIDLDALAAAEDENWVWQGASVLRPGWQRALVELSRGGADATVVREFDLERREFVDGGFALPEAKTFLCWIDADRVYVGTDFGPGSLTVSGYPRVVKEWRRGTPLAEAATVYEAKPDDVLAEAEHDPADDRGVVTRWIDFYRKERFVRTATGLTRIDVPDDAEAEPHREWLLIRTRSNWTVGGSTYPAGALLAARFNAYLAGDYLAGERELTVLFQPDARTSLGDYAWTRSHLILTTLEDVKSRLTALTPPRDAGGEWSAAPLAGPPELAAAKVVDTDPDRSDEYFLDVSGFTQPAKLLRGELSTGELGADELSAGKLGAGALSADRGPEPETLKQAPAFFDASGLTARQHFATSADGTRIPYFVVGPPEPTGPTLLTGYGGFEIALTPSYSGIVGRGWLARGGTYVVANVRGGGEYGPEWHQSVMRHNRLKVYEDFAAVARDLIARGITTPNRLGIQGGSNGGLLMGVMLTRYPELFGAIVSQAPLLDMRRYHTLLAGHSWMTEYGDPDDPADWAYLRRYSPYHNLDPVRPAPPTLLYTSTRDDRVHPGHARKMAARMRELGLDVRYYENIEGGHAGAADNEQTAYKWALIFEFLWQRLGTDAAR
ncbi:MAG: prolyl oligopeptidase family serine peptidase [Micromonosporaceae bacterium]|nr:prolyl oligopeptidase family serine peptidase [Micromonosporaceae bacterium]